MRFLCDHAENHLITRNQVHYNMNGLQNVVNYYAIEHNLQLQNTVDSPFSEVKNDTRENMLQITNQAKIQLDRSFEEGSGIDSDFQEVCM